MFAKLIVKAAMLFLGKVASDAYELCLRHVRIVETTYPNKPGIEKFDIVRKYVLEEFKGMSIPKYLINMLIEAAVTVVKEESKTK
jgi:hypothetical protein